MQPEVMLTVYEGNGNVRRIPLPSGRFSIGRSQENDLAIDDPGMSRRHAIIDTFDGVIQVSDCGSQNGTFVNRRQISHATVLKDGDRILLGDACDIRVQISRRDQRPAATLTTPSQKDAREVAAKAFSLPVIAALCAGLVVLLSALIFYALKTRHESAPSGTITTAPRPDSPSEPVPTLPAPPPPTDDSPPARVQGLIRQLMLGISNDQQPYILPTGKPEIILKRIEPYRGSAALANALRALKPHSKGEEGLKKIERIVLNITNYVALVKTDGGSRGSAAALSTEIKKEVEHVRVKFGADSAEESLILIAAYKMGPGTNKFHPLENVLAKVPLSERNIWYMHDKGRLSDEIYNFVLDFLALAVIAQEPRQFQVDADPLAF